MATVETLHASERERQCRKLLKQRVLAYFRGRPEGAGGGWRIYAKAVFGICWLVSSYAALLLVPTSVAAFLALFVLHGLGQAYLLVNVSHDAVHGAITNRRAVNRVGLLGLDVCGLDGPAHRWAHLELHHGHMNIGVIDESLRMRGVVRVSPHQPEGRLGRFQHLLAWVIYAFASLDFILTRDVETALRGPINVAGVIARKSVYLAMMLAVPMLVTPHGPFTVLAAFVLMHLFIGFLVMLLLQTTHLVESTQFPASLEGLPGDITHTLITTADFGLESRLLAFVGGGLNLHVAHHLFPGVCHVHYPAITRIIARTADECGILYRSHPTLWAAMRAHFRLLKDLRSSSSAGGCEPGNLALGPG